LRFAGQGLHCGVCFLGLRQYCLARCPAAAAARRPNFCGQGSKVRQGGRSLGAAKVERRRPACLHMPIRNAVLGGSPFSCRIRLAALKASSWASSQLYRALAGRMALY
jgi:hypothetical protein